MKPKGHPARLTFQRTGRPRSGAGRIQRFPHPLERRRSWYPHPEASQGRVREAAV